MSRFLTYLRRPECCAGFSKIGKGCQTLRATGIDLEEHEIHPSKVATIMLRVGGSRTLEMTTSGKSMKYVDT